MKLFYREYGEGKPFVILHGLFGFSDNWTSHAKKLADYYRVILVDLRNHGHSPWSDEFSYELMVKDLNELVALLNLKKFILLGHSMGGKVAMRYAQLNPESLDKLVVVDMGVKEYPPHHQHIITAIKAIDTTKLSSRSEAELHLKKYVENEGIIQFLLKNLYWKPGQLAFRFNLAVFNKKITEIGVSLPADLVFEKPTLFIRGGNSNYILDEDFEAIKVQFPKAILETIPNAGHWLHAENPALFYQLSLSYLN